MKKGLFVIFPILFLSFSSCKKGKVIVAEIKEYLHVSHTRTNSNPDMDSVVEQLDYKKYDVLMLGGDLAQLTSDDDTTMQHVDSIFNIGNDNTLWSLGNHDYTDLARVQSFTNRSPYYAYYKNGITFIVLDTQDSLSNIVSQQKIFFDAVVDTIQFSSHLIVLHHKLIWMYGDSYLEPQIPSVSNAPVGSCFYCINPNNFYSEVYPKLLSVKSRGIEVICIGGDIGFNAKSFSHKTSEGIYFLASGINAGSNSNKALFFRHDVYNRKLIWEFKLLSDL